MTTDTKTKTAPAKAAAATPNRALTPLDEVKHALLSPEMGRQFQAALPAHIPLDKFQRVAATAVANNAELVQADRNTLYSACMKAAQDGLLPDGREAALVIFNTKDGDRWIKKAQYMPMVAGILKKIRNSGELKELSAHVVYSNDRFDYYIDDTGEHLMHRPLLDGDRGTFRRVYAIATTKEGGRYIEVMSKEQVDDVASVSKSKDSKGNPTGPWRDWYPEMARKTVIRRLSKRLPMSTDLDDLLHRDDDLYDLRGREALVDKGPAEVVSTDTSKRPRRLQAVVDAATPATSAPGAATVATQTSAPQMAGMGDAPPAGHPAAESPPDDAGPAGEAI